MIKNINYMYNNFTFLNKLTILSQNRNLSRWGSVYHFENIVHNIWYFQFLFQICNSSSFEDITLTFIVKCLEFVLFEQIQCSLSWVDCFGKLISFILEKCATDSFCFKVLTIKFVCFKILTCRNIKLTITGWLVFVIFSPATK